MMALRTQNIFKNFEYIKCPWKPKAKLYNVPKKPDLLFSSPNNDVHNQNLCRLSLLFPRISLEKISEVFEANGSSVLKTIDTLLFLQMMQKEFRRKQSMKENFLPGSSSLAASNCISVLKLPSPQALKTYYGEIPKITRKRMAEKPAFLFGEPNTRFCPRKPGAKTQNALNLVLPSVLKKNNQVPVPKVAIAEEDGSRFPIRLRVKKQENGQYCAKLLTT